MKYSSLILWFLILVTTSSCLYLPMPTDVPLISKKKDLRVDAGISSGLAIHSTVSYGITDKLAVQGFGHLNANDEYYFQVATGHYKKLKNNKILEFYGGLGYGNTHVSTSGDSGHLRGNYQQYFVQTNFGKIASQSSNFEVGLGLKAGYFHSNLTDHGYYKPRPSAPNFYKKYYDDIALIEPIGVIRMGGEHIRFTIKFGGLLFYKFTNTDKSLPITPFNLGFGINYRL